MTVWCSEASGGEADGEVDRPEHFFQVRQKSDHLLRRHVSRVNLRRSGRNFLEDEMRKVLLACGATVALLSSATPVMAAPLSPAQASAACAAYFGVAAGPEPLSACQWDIREIDAGAESYAIADGTGVKVGVIDGGVDFTHPDLAGAIDVGLSCSFIFDHDPTAVAFRSRSATATARTRRPSRTCRVTAHMSPRPSPVG